MATLTIIGALASFAIWACSNYPAEIVTAVALGVAIGLGKH